jgi:hypothetical protein
MKYSEVAAINVNEHVEKKQNLSYLSWAWAVDQLMRLDDNAMWEYHPHQMFGDTMMVFCTVTAFGRSRTSQLPVMDHRNKSISNPDSFQVNVAMQRCLAKAIALHGLGLYIYSGEDLPMEEKKEEPKVEPKKPEAEQKADLTPDSSEMKVPDLNEADAVDWIVQFATEMIPDLGSPESLREFWGTNKSTLSRVEKFSKSRYDALLTAFKQRVADLNTPKEAV